MHEHQTTTPPPRATVPGTTVHDTGTTVSTNQIERNQVPLTREINKDNKDLIYIIIKVQT